MERQFDSPRFRQELDRHIEGLDVRQRMNPQELKDIRARAHRPIKNEAQAQQFLRQERETGMREQLFKPKIGRQRHRKTENTQTCEHRVVYRFSGGDSDFWVCHDCGVKFDHLTIDGKKVRSLIPV